MSSPESVSARSFPSLSLPLPSFPSLESVITLVPPRHKVTVLDYAIGWAAQYMVIASLLAPPTPGVKFFRAAVVTPIAVALFAYCALIPTKDDYADSWGVGVLMTFWAARTMELLVFYPAEENVYRLVRGPSSTKPLRPPPDAHGLRNQPNGHSETNGYGHSVVLQATIELLPEPVPDPWTLEKWYWANHLWWSQRGIGWNYAPALPSSSTRHPFTLTSSRKAFLLNRLLYYTFALLVNDAARTYMDCSSAAPYFSGLPGSAKYSELSTGTKGLYSLCIAIRIWFSMEEAQVPVSMLFVCIGGALGWETECFTPWGWPPLFGGFIDIWRYPGLSTAWSKIWQQLSRRWLYALGWVGIGETVLGLPVSGAPVNAPPPPSGLAMSHDNVPVTLLNTRLATSTPSVSGQTSPAHPLPTEPDTGKPPSGESSPGRMLGNFLKSLIVFLLIGLAHDTGSIFITLHGAGLYGRLPKWREMFITTPFFLAQPFGLAIEAAFKTRWRRWKRSRHPAWRKARDQQRSNGDGDGDVEPDWLIFLERTIGFIWTWTFLGYTAGPWVDGLVKFGMWRRDDTQSLVWSLFGGLYYGRWLH